MVEIREEPLPALSETPLSNKLINFKIKSKPDTCLLTHSAAQSICDEATSSTFHDMLPCDQRILNKELRALLPDLHWDLIDGKILNEMTYRELEELYGTKPSTAEYRIRTGLAKMEKFIEEDWTQTAS